MFLPENAILLIIDVQGKLARLMHKKESLFLHIGGLVRVAQFLEIPIIVTEQAPLKIGKTVPEIAGLLKDHQPIAKTSFSCCADKIFMRALEACNRRQVIIAGIETHVCVYQTANELIAQGYEVQVVSDAVSSRAQADKDIGLKRIRSIGGDVTSSEMIVCELLRSSEHPKFREVISLIK